jgi:hypothetical protein
MAIPSKLIWLVLFAIGGTSYVIYRKIISAVDKSSVGSLINALQKNPEKAKDFANALDIPYGKRENFSSTDFTNLQTTLQSITKIGDYTILHQVAADPDRYLLITEIAFSDFDIGMRGEATDVKRIAYHSFAIHFEREAGTLSVWSDLYNDTTSKFQKEAFCKGITAL